MDERVGATGPDAGPVDVDDVARRVLIGLLARPEVVRAGLALVEGAGRRLLFTASDRLDGDGVPRWCHVDAYDDVPLASVVRTGEPVLAAVDDLAERYAVFAAHQRAAGVAAVAALPLPGRADPVGGLVVYFGESQSFDDRQAEELTTTAQEVAMALEPRRSAPASRSAGEATGGGSVGDAQVAVTVVGGDPRAARTARQFLREELSAWSVDEELGDVAVLCLSELVTNAVMHTGTPSELRVTLDDEILTLAVRDHGQAAPDVAASTEDADPLRVHGRGLQVIDALAQRWGVEHDEAGTTVWVELDRVAG